MNRELILNLGKLMVAVAWVDGILAPQEVEALRGLVARIPGITVRETGQIEIFMAHLVSDVERETLVRLVGDLIKTPEEKALVLSSLRSVVACDGEVTQEEEAALASIEQALSQADVGVLRSLSQVLWRSVSRQQAQPQQVAREDKVDDFLRNRVFYYLTLDPRGKAMAKELGDDKARIASLSAGLMLRVACASWDDARIAAQDEPPYASVLPHLLLLHDITEPQARLFVEIAWLGFIRGLDGFLLGCALECRGNKDELYECFAALLAVAQTNGEVDPSSKDELLDIAHALMFDQDAITLSHQIYLHKHANPSA